MKELDLSVFDLPDYLYFSLHKTNEERIRRWIQHNRTRTILSKKEIKHLFSIKYKVQIKEVKKINLKLFDKVIFYNNNEWYVLDVVDYEIISKTFDNSLRNI